MELRKAILPIVITILLFIIIILALVNILAATKPGFTELYFVDELPKTVLPDQEYQFSFAIHNLENKRTTYNYVVNVKSQIIKEGTLTLNRGDTAIVSPRFIVQTRLKTQILFSVRLTGKDQEIHFWADIK
jgi:hypothetical protein